MEMQRVGRDTHVQLAWSYRSSCWFTNIEENFPRFSFEHKIKSTLAVTGTAGPWAIISLLRGMQRDGVSPSHLCAIASPLLDTGSATVIAQFSALMAHLHSTTTSSTGHNGTAWRPLTANSTPLDLIASALTLTFLLLATKGIYIVYVFRLNRYQTNFSEQR